MEHLETLVDEWASLVKLILETASILAITVGGVVALWTLVANFSNPEWLSITRSKLSGYLILALEIQLAADIVGTAVTPTWEQLGKLAGIALIRTFLNYFLMAEMREEKEDKSDIAA